MSVTLSVKERMGVLLESLPVINTRPFEQVDPQIQCRSRGGKQCAAYEVQSDPLWVLSGRPPVKTCWIYEILAAIADYSASSTPTRVGRGWEVGWLDHLNPDKPGKASKSERVMPETASCPLLFANYDYQTLVAWLRACIQNEDE